MKPQRITQDHNIGSNLRKLRKRNDLTQRQVAEELCRMGIRTSREIYAQIECGTHGIPVSMLKNLKILYGCTYDDIFLQDKSTP